MSEIPNTVEELRTKVYEHAQKHAVWLSAGDGPIRDAAGKGADALQNTIIAAFRAQVERNEELKAALQFYADCEWGWNGGGYYEPMIMRLPDTVPNTLDCKFAGSVAKAALEEATDD